MNEMADMAVHWDTVAETVHFEQPAVSLVNSSDGDDGHVKVSPGSERENGSEHPHEYLGDMEAEESKEQNENNSTTEDLSDDQEEDGNLENHAKDRFKEKKLENEPSMDGESKSRNAGAGKKGKSKRSGSGQSLCDQTPLLTSPFSMSHKSFLSSSGPNRHKQVRKRNHYMHNHGRTRQRNGLQLVVTCRDFVAESISPWCISCIHMIVELIISLTHRCGIAVESSGIALYEFGVHLFWKVTDVPGMTEDLRRVLDWSRRLTVALLERASRTAGWAHQSLVSGMRTLGVAVCSTSQIMSYVFVKLAGERGRKWWLSLQSSRLWRKVSDVTMRIRRLCFNGGVMNENSNPESSNRGTEKYQPEEELQRLLALAKIPEEELDPFSVLGVDIHATESELKRAYRQLAIQIHPDKNKHPGADEAFKVLRAAWDIVSNPETRREYELKRMATTELSKSMNEFLAKLQDDLKEAVNTMMCTKCEGKHKRFEMDREASEARFCAECKKWHSAEEGDLWAESRMLGLRITYFAFMDGKVFDITEWAGCQRIGISPDTHRVPYHISFGSKGSSSASRHRSPPDHPGGGAPADLQDFFNSFFQGGVPNNVSANGGFFSEGTPSNQGFRAAAETAGMFSGSPPQTGFFSSTTQRSEPNEHWTEGGKPPRRRKKVRKPFQH
ncbi:dnaJ homolog subfamily C member 14 [Triplophysa rosa]|uniref:DnaJ-like protein subfamily C member 14 n=1 Tax=Triplophysa rosa TaxID=992332 RepID=A0A9W7T4X9_TRIRA|nr:dnaJ homolog subfamily C member 14 [Triplophysa rosa]XP_057183170.1 dnaJ homolog subfamily C member 14 [Triplophysa rosa]XP_057183171.1 dnaJ homolog subfamily C member 14 [Triplophysa rosa]XP_057183172.1 dnaJ homolog subfamily C member 14 [Triplophysa rosa]XP_057183173.1 dnaJ homolog subfamily C member 14 [Triplophysa rosa]KAI7789819.1 putative dnaJ-like protein subfamily C member 14 [Triplophysa rosa]